MPELPSDWTRAQVKDVVDPARHVTYGIVQPGPRQRDDVGVPIIRGQDYSSGLVATKGLYHVLPHIAASYSRSTVKAGDLILSIVGYVGTSAQVPQELEGANLTQTTARVAIRGDFSPRYFLHYFRGPAFQYEVNRFTKGSAQPGLNLGDVEVMRLAFPPLPEQRRIAEILDTIDEAIRKTERITAKLEQVKQGLLRDLLTRGIDDNGELRDPDRHPEQFKDSPLGRIPKVWETRLLGECIARSPQNGLYKPGTAYSDAGTPIVRIDGFYDGPVAPVATLKRVRLTDVERTTYVLQQGDLLVNRVNSIDYVGKVGFVWESDIAVFESNMMRVAVDRARLLPEFALHWLCSPWSKAHFHRRAKHAIAQASVNQTDVVELPIAVPPLAEQTAVARCAADLVARTTAEEATLSKLRLAKRGLMEDLLTGRVRVTALLDQTPE